MRKFRTAALAVATASTVALAGTTVATAAPNALGSLDFIDTTAENAESEGSSNKIDPEGSLELDKPANGESLFGSSTGNWGSGDTRFGFDLTGQNATDREDIPVWAQLVYGAALTGLLALVAAPLLSHIKAPAINLPAIQLPNLAPAAPAGSSLPTIQLPAPAPAAPAPAPAAPAAHGSSIVWNDIVIKVPAIVWN